MVDLCCLNSEHRSRPKVFGIVRPNVAVGGLTIIIRTKLPFYSVYGANGLAMVVDGTPLTGPPAQHKAFKIFVLVNEITSITIFRELNIALDLFPFRFKSGDESAQIRKRHLRGSVFQLFNCRGEVHKSNLRSRAAPNQATRQFLRVRNRTIL